MSDQSNEEQIRRWQERNQINAVHGALPVMPEDWEHIDSVATKIDENTFGVRGLLNNNDIARAIAADMVRYQREQLATFKTRWCPGFDEAKPETMARCYALAEGELSLFPLAHPSQWSEVAEHYCTDWDCHAQIVRKCKSTPAARERIEAVAVTRGEIICIFGICSLCRDALSWISFDHASYTGPRP